MVEEEGAVVGSSLSIRSLAVSLCRSRASRMNALTGEFCAVALALLPLAKSCVASTSSAADDLTRAQAD